MTYDRRAIMNNAWAIAREEISRSVVPLSAANRRFVFARALRNAWGIARIARRSARVSPAVRAIEWEIAALEGVNRWTPADYARRSRLTAELSAALAA